MRNLNYIFKATTENYASALSNSTWTNAQVTVDGTTVYVIAEDPSSAVSCVISATCGFTKVECHTDAVPVFPPSISVTAASIEVPAAGGNCTIIYTVKNPVDGKSISARSNQTWVNGFDYSTSGQVSFVVDANTGEKRNASITLSYEGADDVTVPVTQFSNAVEETWTWTAASGDLGAGTLYSATLNEKAWSVTRSAVKFNGFTDSCIQLGKKDGAETVTLTSNAFTGTIKKVAVECSSYNAAHKVDITVGGTSYKSGVSTAKWTTIGTVSGTGTSSGEIVIKFNAGSGSRALYIKSISITYEGGSTGGGETGGGETGGGETGGGETGGGETAVEFTYSSLYSNITGSSSKNVTSDTVGEVTMTYTKVSGNNPPMYYANGTSLRIYNESTITVEVPSGKYLKKIDFNQGTTTWASGKMTSDFGTIDDTNKNWSSNGSVNKVVLTIKGSFRFTKIVVTYK